MNWGKGIAIAMGLFITFIIVLTSTMMSKQVDLVSENYYQQEINYQDEIDAVQSGAQLEPIKSYVEDQFLVFRIPDSTAAKSIAVQLSRPNDSKLDQTFVIEGTKLYLFPLEQLKKGSYTARYAFSIDGVEYVQYADISI